MSGSSPASLVTGLPILDLGNSMIRLVRSPWEIADTIPMDLRLTLTKAEQLLAMSFPGVDEVLAR